MPGANAPIYYTDDGIGVTPTGMGKAESTVTVAALLASPRLDLSATYFMTAGVAGAPLSRATVGSVVLAETVVDWDRKHRWAENERALSDDADRTPDDPPIALLKYRPRDYVHRLNDDLVSAVRRAAETVDLRDDDRATPYRERYTESAARSAPAVTTGTSLSGDEFWHGDACAAQAQWLADAYGAGDYAVTEMEDFGTATALDRFGRLDRYLSVRGVVNFDRPGDGQSPRESLDEDLDPVALELGLENGFRVASAAVDRLAADDPTDLSERE
ncbi:purine nucleoside permease (plasmid) [Halorussus vallis]|nr:purine nucleoside permease [Halorussus vallis]USZ78407.1 purine nucleoside permease [Halorussus vallis]